MALARERLTEEFGDTVRTLTLTVAASVTIYKGALVCLDSTGKAIPGNTIANGAVMAVGKALHTASAGEDVQVSCGVRKYLNSALTDAITDAEVGKPCYVVDDQTVAKTSSTGARVKAGTVVQVDSDGVRVMFSPVEAASLGMVQMRQVTVGHADLTAAATTQTINVGTPVPAGAMVLGVCVGAVTAFSGGSVTDMVIDIGDSGDADCLIDGADVVGSVVDSQAISRPLGINPNKLYPAATQITALFTATGDNVVNLTAGTCTITVLFTLTA